MYSFLNVFLIANDMKCVECKEINKHFRAPGLKFLATV